MDKGKRAYLDNACIGKVPEEVADFAKEMIDKFRELKGSPTDFTVSLYDQYEEGRGIIADVLRVEKEAICYVESTSHGLGMIANSIPLTPGDNVLVCDLEFFSTVLCWKQHMKRVGFTVKPVKTMGGCVTPQDFIREADAHTKAIVVSAVQEINGYRVDMEGISRFARAIGAWLIVDGIQEVGALDPHLDRGLVDVYCAGGHKWLKNPFGTGFMYIRPELAETLEPDFYGYFNAIPPAGGWGPYLEAPQRTPFDSLEMTKSAAKFETGATVNYIGAAALAKNFQRMEKLGLDWMEDEITSRRRYLQAGLLNAGASVCGSTERPTLSGICTFNLPGGICQEKQLMKRLEERNIFCSLRYISQVGGIRVSPHYDTAYEEIDRLTETLEDFMK